MLSGKDDAGRQVHLKDLACHTSHTESVSPTKNGRLIRMNTPAAKLDNTSLTAKPTTKPVTLRPAMNGDTSNPEVPGNKANQYQPKEDLDAALAQYF